MSHRLSSLGPRKKERERTARLHSSIGDLGAQKENNLIGLRSHPPEALSGLEAAVVSWQLEHSPVHADPCPSDAEGHFNLTYRWVLADVSATCMPFTEVQFVGLSDGPKRVAH
ncbi:expressed unknown protein [Seminavis robusta]|uniref:Uncharacterized protein n=1 Tax=Seminavis robusta TaxID=568900 RepID=A0A9N8I0F9_9STRA|nr:expressed unknown protein [Seminavis robusta]|eukprot:Sro2678_g334440.1 n/a (113) ;mRNA; r:1343-1771